MVAAVVVNSQGGLEGGQSAEPQDFFPYLADDVAGQTSEQLIAELKGRGAVDLRGGDGSGA